MKKNIKLLLILISTICFSQGKIENTLFNKSEVTINPLIKGSLYTPLKQNNNTKLIILIAGSGPTDRDGNQIGMSTNCTKYLCEELAKNETAVFSYDKRIIAQMASGKVNEKELSFDNFINDAKDVIAFFKSQKKYKKIIIGGHSEGSLIGMIAANANADAFISLAGAGRTIDFIIEDQIERQAPTMKEEVHKYFEILKKGEIFELKNPMLASIFRESVQPYMISWIKYDPQIEIKKLQIPVLIINGTKDLQVTISEAELLKKVKQDAKLEIIENMNHILKEIKEGDTENRASYTNPDLPIIKELIIKVNDFIKSI